jgi:hypothetical protein
VGQVIWHTPPAHAWPGPHAMPQPPQFAGSAEVVTHWPLQLVCPGPQRHMPDWQLVPPVHTTPQAPQLLLFEDTLVHTPLHSC